MIINNKEYNVDDLVLKFNSDNDFIHDVGNGIYLSNNQISILKNFGIDYKKYSSLSSLIFEIENVINEDYDLDLENLVNVLAEINYYKNTKK